MIYKFDWKSEDLTCELNGLLVIERIIPQLKYGNCRSSIYNIY